jgi:hypothetical protein
MGEEEQGTVGEEVSFSTVSLSLSFEMLISHFLIYPLSNIGCDKCGPCGGGGGKFFNSFSLSELRVADNPLSDNPLSNICSTNVDPMGEEQEQVSSKSGANEGRGGCQ